MSVPRWAARLFDLGALALALAAVAVQVHLVASTAMGVDFVPVRAAAVALLHGRSVYTDPNFVYPPTAALALLPTAAGSIGTAFTCWLACFAAALFGAAVLVARAAPHSRRRVLALAALVLLGGAVASDALAVGNLTPPMAPVAVAVLLAFHRGRWRLGSALLVGSLLVKPLLLPLLLVPVLRRRWRALAECAIPGALLLLAAVLAVPGGTRFGQVLRYLLGGTNLHGANAINNLSLRGWVEAHRAPAALGIALAAAFGLTALVAVVRAVRAPRPPDAVRLGAFALCTTMLVSDISEEHYLLVLAAMTLLYVALDPTPRRVVAVAPALVLVGLPAAYLSLLGLDGLRQSCWVLAELLLFAALLPRTPARRRGRATPSPVPPPARVPAAAPA